MPPREIGEYETTEILVLRADGTVEEPIFVVDPENPADAIMSGVTLHAGDQLVITSEVTL